MFLLLTLIWILSSTTVECQECSTSGLNVFGGYQYVFYSVGRTFSETRAHCQSLGGNVPIITSAEQNDFIAMRIPRDDNFYIGLEDMDEDGTYRWIDGTAPGYINWDISLNTGSNHPPPYCAVMKSGSRLTDSIRGRWNRVTCTSRRQTICQIPIDAACRWHEYGESQYLIMEKPKVTFNYAREKCRGYGGDLAMMKTTEINKFLKYLLPPCTSCHPYFCYWFGLRRSGWGNFTWLDGTTLEYTDWYKGVEPNSANSWGCLGLRDGPAWYDTTSHQSFPYICERTRVFDGSSEASFGGLDYFTSPSWLARSFSDARTYCQYHGADLALIKSHDINTFLHVRSSGLSTHVFFGLTNQAVEGTFTWINGSPVQFSSWKSPEPNGRYDENCASLLSSDPNMGWVDVSCSDKLPFICERYQDVPEYEWSNLDGTLYYISQSSMTSYSFARRFCRAQGGDLAKPKTDEINMYLMKLAEGNSYWFGLDKLNEEDMFQWTDGTPLYNNAFPGWSNGDANLFETERCVYQQVNNGWRKLPCTSYLRFACEQAPSPRQILPVRLMAATPSPYGGGLLNASFICLLGSENEEILTFSTRRLVRLTESITFDSYTAPGDSNILSSVALRQSLPASREGWGFFECSAVTASRMSSVPLGILLSSRQLQPSDGRFTKTIHIGDNITLSMMSMTGMVGEDGVRWRKVTDVDWANSLIGISSGSLSHSIQSASVSDAGVYVTYMDGTLEQHQFSFIRLIVKECPCGRWNPPLCDRLCDSCYNGGVCHELSGTCICPPGHAGKNCLQACGIHKFGWDCEFECGPGHPLDKCAGSQICLPDPYGCNCLAGYTGIYCNETCADGIFGADCLQECHCTDEADCDNVTGECAEDCSQGWSGSACQVPSVCQNGYFGSNCTQKCNCRNGTACHKDSGYCDEVEGRCDLGYVPESVEFPANCMTFSGCFSSCSKTCHCFGGAEDCSFLTGDCLSSTCHPRWMGDQCQTDRFETSSEKTNPGVAIFSCSFTASQGQTLSSDYVKAAVGTLSTELWITRNSSDTSGTTLNNSFIHEYMGPKEAIYCFIGLPENSSEFAFVRLPPSDFFVLPSLNGAPELLEFGYSHAAIGWRQWDPSSDTGDGPIVGYKIYVRSGNVSNVVLAKKVHPLSIVNNTDRSISKRSAENANEMVMYNVSGLEAESTYFVQIAAIRDGISGEGEQGKPLEFTTESEHPVTSGSGGGSSITSAAGGASSITSAAGGAVGAILLILLIMIVAIIVFKRRRNDNNPSNKENTEDQFQASADFQDTSLEEKTYSGHDSVLNSHQTTPRSTRPKPAVAVKSFVRETKSLDLDSTDGSPERSSNKPLATRQPIPLAQFPAFVNRNRHTSLFSEEFHDLPDRDIYPQTVAREEMNFKKNRYKNILPYDSARVKLEVINNNPHSDYFNASYIPSLHNDQAYIASQGPNNASINDFWRMVWQENVTTIAMVTKLKEGDKIKCRQYWPDRKRHAVEFGTIKVELMAHEPCTGGVTRRMVMHKDEESKRVTQFHFTEWPEKGVPKHTSSLLKFIKEVKADHGQNTHPLIIHCSAGVGRTGVVISIDSIVAHANTTRMVDVFNFVTNIRHKRPYMVQTQEQYAFIYGAVLEDLLWRNTLIPVIYFTDHLQDLPTSGDGHGRSKMTKEFETLKSLCPDPPASQTRSGRTPDNHPKNRYGNNIPLERNRVILDSPDHDYINASYMKGVHCTFMTTQMPMPTTVSDFWSMVVDYKRSIIVMLNDKSQNDKTCAQYWSDDDSAQFGSYLVATLSTSSDGDMTIRQLKVTRNCKASHTVTQYQFHGWPKHGSDQQSGARSLLKLIRAVKSYTNKKKELSILVHCLSGAGRTGVFCTVMECIAQIAEGDSVDIFKTVKILRADRMQFVQTEEEYAFIYDVIREYLHTENYEQLTYPIEDHTYGNLEIDYTLDPEENPYEVTDPQTENGQDRLKPKPLQPYSLYENFIFES